MPRCDVTAKTPAPVPTIRPKDVIGGFARPRAGGFVAAKAVGSLVPKVTRKAFEKYGFSTATLLMDWATIVGPELALISQPERLKWPRITDRDNPAEARAAGATLVLRVDGSRAIDIQYRARQIMDRINVHFGYRAVSQIRIVQAPVEPAGPMAAAPTPRPRGRAAVESRPGPDMSGIADEGLRAALARMQDGIRGGARVR